MMTLKPLRTAHLPRLALSRRGEAMLALTIGAMFFGGSTVASKAALTDLPPLTLAFARFALGAMVLLLVCHRRGMRPRFGRGPALLGVTGITVPFICQNLGLQFSRAIDLTMVIEGGLPIATAIFGFALLGERINRISGIGLTLAVGGVTLVMLHSATTDRSFSLPGTLLAAGAALSFGLYTVTGRRLFGAGFSLPNVTGGMLIGVGLLAPFAAFEIVRSGPGSFSMSSGLLLLYLGVGGSAGTQLLWARGMADLAATEVAIIGTLMPISGVASAALLLGEPVSAVQIIGGLIVIGSVVLTARLTGREVPSSAPAEPLPGVAIDQARLGGSSLGVWSGNPRTSRRASASIAS